MNQFLSSALILLFGSVVFAEKPTPVISSSVSCNGARTLDAGMNGSASYPHVRLEKAADGKYSLYYSQNEVFVEAIPQLNIKGLQIAGVENLLVAEKMECQFTEMKEVIRCVQQNLPNGQYIDVNFRKKTTYGIMVGGYPRIHNDGHLIPLDLVEVEITTSLLKEKPEFQAILKNRAIKIEYASMVMSFDSQTCKFNP